MKKYFGKKIITEQGAPTLPPVAIYNMRDIVNNNMCPFTTNLTYNPADNTWFRQAMSDLNDTIPPVKKGDYYIVSNDVVYNNDEPTGKFALQRGQFYVPGTGNPKKGEFLLRWGCPTFNPQGNQIKTGTLSPKQQEFIDKNRYTNIEGYSLSADTVPGCNTKPINPNECEVLDLYTKDPNLFPKKDVYLLYRSKTAVNKRQTEEQRKIVEAYKSMSGCTDEMPLANQRNQYYEVRLSQIPEFRNLFDSNFVMYCPYSAITKGNRASVIDGIKNKLNMSSVTDDCQFAMTVIYDGLYKRKNQYSRQLEIQEITYLKNVLKQCATARDERGRAFNFRYKNNYQELVRQNIIAESKTKDLTTIIREQLVEAYNRKNRRY